MVCRFAHVYMQSGGPNRERYIGRAAVGGSDGRADRVRAELNGNPVQSGGLNREGLYRAGFNPPRADQTGGRRADWMGGRTGCGLS